MKKGDQKYFLAIIPPEPLAGEITSIKKEFVEKYNSKASLRSPAHITLHMPFQWKERKEERLLNVLAQTSNFSPFNVELNGFGAFSPRTIFIQPKPCEELEAMNMELLEATKRQLNLFHAVHIGGFHPHITVAFRDLRKPMFFEAWKEFEQRAFKASFQVNSFWLLKHNGKSWDAYREFNFCNSQ